MIVSKKIISSDIIFYTARCVNEEEAGYEKVSDVIVVTLLRFWFHKSV